MRTNRMDIVTDLIKKRMTLAFGVAKKEFRNTNPYRKERIPDEERLDDYAQLTDADIEFGAQHFPAEVGNYLKDMDELMRRKNDTTTMGTL